MLYKKLFKKINMLLVLLTSMLVCGQVYSHPGSEGHQHNVFEQIVSVIGYAGIIVLAFIVVKLCVNSKKRNGEEM